MRLLTDSTWNRTTTFAWLLTLLFIGFTPAMTRSYNQEQYRRCRDLNGGRSEYDVSENHSHSISISVASSLQGFYDSRCEICSEKLKGADKYTLTEKSNATRVVVLATSATPSFEKSLIVTAGLLTAKSYVTIVMGPNMPDPSLIRQILFQHIPCDQHFITSMLLDFKQLNVDSRQLSCPSITADPVNQSPGDFLLCNVQNSEVIVNALNDLLHRVLRPSVFILDASCIAGMLAAEKWKIPAIVLVEHSEIFLRYVFGAPPEFKISSPNGMTQPTLWEIVKSVSHNLDPRIFFVSLSGALQDRLHSLDLTNTFIALNRVRVRLKMQRLRHVTDIWKRGGNVLLANNHATIIINQGNQGNPVKTSGNYSGKHHDFIAVETVKRSRWSHMLQNLYTIPDPLLPPCIACTNAPITTKPTNESVSIKSTIASSGKKKKIAAIGRTQPPVIVLSIAFRNDEKGRSGSRTLILALWLALQSVKKLSQFACNADEKLSNKSSCWYGPSEFQVVRPGMMPEILPPGNIPIMHYDDDIVHEKKFQFISAEETTFIDTLARHRPIAMISACDSANIWTQSLGPPVLCIDTSWSARKIAASIVSLLRNLNSRKRTLIDIQNSTATNITDRNDDSRKSTWSVNHDGLEWIIAVVERLSTLQRKRKMDWEAGRRMSLDILSELQDLAWNSRETLHQIDVNSEEESLVGLSLVYVAWIILILFVLCLPLKYYVWTALALWLGHLSRLSSVYGGGRLHLSGKRVNNERKCEHEAYHDFHTFQHSLNQHHSRLIIFHESYYGFVDFELAWQAWTSWIRDVLDQWHDNADPSVSPSQNDHCFQSFIRPMKSEDFVPNHNTTNGISRKRRSMKKRH